MVEKADNTSFEEAVMKVIRDNLRVETSFKGWEYGFCSNDLEVRIMLGDEQIAVSNVALDIQTDD